MRKSFFLDRDGVINFDSGYTYKVSDLVFEEFSIDGLRKLSLMGDLYIVTNQSGIGRGFYSTADFLCFMNEMFDQLRKFDIAFVDFRYCPHAPSPLEHDCGCRKPSPGMIIDLVKAHAVDLSKSFMIGDKLSDIEAGKRAGVNSCVLIDKVNSLTLQRSARDYLIFPHLLAFAESLN